MSYRTQLVVLVSGHSKPWPIFLRSFTNLVIGDTHKWLDSSHKNLPAAHTKHPYVTQPSEPTEIDTLWGHPFDGQLTVRGWGYELINMCTVELAHCYA